MTLFRFTGIYLALSFVIHIEAQRNTTCDDGTLLSDKCTFLPPKSTDVAFCETRDLVLALQNGCHQCVNRITCKVPEAVKQKQKSPEVELQSPLDQSEQPLVQEEIELQIAHGEEKYVGKKKEQGSVSLNVQEAGKAHTTVKEMPHGSGDSIENKSQTAIAKDTKDAMASPIELQMVESENIKIKKHSVHIQQGKAASAIDLNMSTKRSMNPWLVSSPIVIIAIVAIAAALSRRKNQQHVNQFELLRQKDEDDDEEVNEMEDKFNPFYRSNKKKQLEIQAREREEDLEYAGTCEEEDLNEHIQTAYRPKQK